MMRSGLTIVLTGATSGIGLSLAKQLSQAGNHLILLGRNSARLNEVRNLLLESNPGLQFSTHCCDLSSQKEIRKVAAIILETNPRIDVLINNAGAVYESFSLSEDGIEMTMAINYYATFLLSECLTPALMNAPKGRIIHVASSAHRHGHFDLNLLTSANNYRPTTAYANAKLFMVMDAITRAEKLSESRVKVNAICPGLVSTPIGRKNMPWYKAMMWTIASTVFGKTSEAGAKPIARLALSDECDKISGKFFSQFEISQPAEESLESHKRQMLWKWSFERSLFD